MKNFPHQFNQIPRLVNALQVLKELINSDQDVDDDGVVGDALARAGVYRFRNNDRPIEDLLEEEHQKERGKQGTRTCARALRRLFRLLNFLTEDNSLSQDANRLVELQDDPLGIESRIIWRAALDEMELTDETGTSHPYRILLRLVSEHPGIRSFLLGLCLEAKDDSDAEFQRISGLTTHSSLESLRQSIGITKSMANNSLKILPALARQLGDILESEDGYHINQSSVSIEPYEPTVVNPVRARQTRRRFDPERVQRSRSERGEQDRIVQRVYDTDLVAKRFQAHQECLLRMSNLIPDSFKQYYGLYDLLVVGEKEALIVEVKTIRDDDAARQIRLALGQVLYYQHFLIEPDYPNHKILRLVITDTKPSSDLVDFLEKYQVGIAWLPPNQQSGQSPLSESILYEFGIVLG